MSMETPVTAMQAAMDRLDFDEVDRLLSAGAVHYLGRAAHYERLRARTARLRGRTDEAAEYDKTAGEIEAMASLLSQMGEPA